jgi:3-phenylpropionate/trans-cinnamate dioxygenase ferredoxin subunit
MAQWLEACGVSDVELEGVIRFDQGDRTFAVYRSPDGDFFCTDGLCSHEAVHLADGFVMDYEIECPKHSGAFDYRTGAAKRLPPCVNLRTYPARVEGGRVLIELT